MIGRGLLSAAILALALQVPLLASAGGSIDAGILAIEIRDAFGDCSRTVTRFCEFRLTNASDPQNATLDAYQRIDSVSVTLDPSLANRAAHHDLIEPRSVAVSGNETYISNPFLPFVSEAWMELDAQRPGRETFDLETNRENITIVHPYIQRNTSQPIYQTAISFPYPDDGGLGYDRIGPYNAPTGNSTDEYLAQGQRMTCNYDDVQETCEPVFTLARESLTATAPNVVVGVEFYNASVEISQRNAATGYGNWSVAGAAEYRSNEMFEPYRFVLDSSGPLAVYNFTPGSLVWRSASGLGPPWAPPPGPSEAQASRSDAFSLWRAGLVAAAVGAVLLFAATALYSRLAGKNAVLASATRKKLLALIEENPGLSPTDAARRLSIGRNAIMHHARLLQKAEFIKIIAENGKTFFYGPGHKPTKQEILTSHPVAEIVLRHVHASGTTTMKELLLACQSIPERTCYYHVKRLANAGLLLVERQGQGRLLVKVAQEPTRPAPRATTVSGVAASG